MKKTLAFLLAGVMALSLAACGGNEKSESGAYTTKAQSEAAQETTQAVEQTKRETETPTEKEKTTVELTPDNWNNYLEPVIKYRFEKDDWGEIKAIETVLYFLPKEDSGVTSFNDVRIAVRITPDELSTINMNKTTEEYTLEKLSERPSDSPFEKEYSIRVDGHNFDPDGNSVFYLSYDINTPIGSTEELQDLGQAISANVVSHYNVEATRIIGTLTIESGKYKYKY